MNLNLDLIQTVLLLLYIALTMLTMGFRLTWSQVRVLPQHRSLIGRALLVNIILVPFIAFLLYRLIEMPVEMAIGLFLAASAPGAPFAPKLAERAKGPLPIAVGLMFVLALVSVVTTPVTVTVGLLAEGVAQVEVLLIFFMLVPVQSLPLLAGVAINSRWETVAQRLMKPLTWIASAVGLLVILLIVVTDLNKILSVDWRTITAALILAGAALAMGWLLGGPGPLSRRVLAVTTSARNVAVAMLIAATTFPGTGVDVGVMAYAVVMLVVDVALVAYWNRQSHASADLREMG